MRTGDITVTPYRGRKALKSVMELTKTKDDNEEKQHEENLKIRIGEVVKFYPGTDKVLVELLETKKIIRCKLLHSIVSGECNVSFMPIGTSKLDTDYNEASIIPINKFYCAVLDINNNDNETEYGVIGFLSLNKSLIRNNAESGEYLIENDSSSISIKANQIHIKTPQLLINNETYMENVEMVSLNDLFNLESRLTSSINDLNSRVKNIEDKIL
jgi:hypothetical protein